VDGFRSECPLQKCFRGKRIDQFNTRTAREAVRRVFDQMDRYSVRLCCGVGAGPKTELARQNFHWALRYETDSIIEAHTYNGYRVTGHNAVALPIPGCRWVGTDGIAKTTRCKNFRFGVEYFGYPSR